MINIAALADKIVNGGNEFTWDNLSALSLKSKRDTLLTLSQGAQLVNTVADLIYSDETKIAEKLDRVKIQFSLIASIINDDFWEQEKLNDVYLWPLIKHAIKNNRPEFLTYILETTSNLKNTMKCWEKSTRGLDLNYPLHLIDSYSQLKPKLSGQKINAPLSNALEDFAYNGKVWDKLINPINWDLIDFFSHIDSFNDAIIDIDQWKNINNSPLYKIVKIHSTSDAKKIFTAFHVPVEPLNTFIAKLSQENNRENNSLMEKLGNVAKLLADSSKRKREDEEESSSSLPKTALILASSSSSSIFGELSQHQVSDVEKFSRIRTVLAREQNSTDPILNTLLKQLPTSRITSEQLLARDGDLTLFNCVKSESNIGIELLSHIEPASVPQFKDYYFSDGISVIKAILVRAQKISAEAQKKAGLGSR
jgi:hypothetical protein